MPRVDFSTVEFIKYVEYSGREWPNSGKYYPDGDPGQHSIGYGHLITKNPEYWNSINLNSPFTQLTAEQCNQLLAYDLGDNSFYVKPILNDIKIALSQCQFNALVSRRYNAGNLYWKELVRAINAGGENVTADGIEEINKWLAVLSTGRNGSGTISIAGRRNQEKQMYWNCSTVDSKFGAEQKNKAYSISEKSNFEQFNGNSDEAVKNEFNSKLLLSQMQEIESNLYSLERDNTDVIWGSRSSAFETSDWIGLKQYIMYLSMTYAPQSLFPFVELIPKFFIDEPKKDTKNSDALGFDTLMTPNDINRFNNLRNKINTQNSNGGIDMLSLDPFQDYSNFLNHDNDNNKRMKSADTGRGFGYRIFGALVINPGIVGDETSKAGAIGFKSLEIQSGLNVQQGFTLISMKLVDVQGNKFLDITSPWSFMLNAAKVGGDFYFRYGWQLRVPEMDTDVNSTGYKFWNHAGWGLFGDEILKKELAGRAKACDGVITLTQSTDKDSFWAPGYTVQPDSSGIAVFSIDRKLNLSNYVTISLINPELTVNSQDGSIEANLQFRNSNTVANCFVPLSEGKEMHDFVNENSDTNLYDFMNKFVTDNYEFVKKDPEKDSVKDLAIRPDNGNNGENTWLTVKSVQDPNRVIDPKSVKIKINNDLLEELNKNISSPNTNVLLFAWVDKVLQFNKMIIKGAGDAPPLNANQGSGFIVLYDDNATTKENVSSVIGNEASGFLGSNGMQRLSIQDDVLSFKFKGSLVEDLKIESNENPSAQSIQAKRETAEANAPVNEVSNATAFAGQGQLVTWKEKAANKIFQLSKLRNATVVVIAHPWVRPGFPIFIKGTGYFDGKYIVATVKHTLNDDNKFTSEISCVRAAIDKDYEDKIKEIAMSQEFVQNFPGVGIATPINQGQSKNFFNNNNLVNIPNTGR